MKRSIFILLILFTSFMYANPIDASPTIYEIQIIEPDNWFIEINAPYGSIVDIDSIFIESLSGKAKVDFLDSSTIYPVITQESMSENLQFSRERDSISIHIYGYSSNNYNYSRSFVIGDFSGSYLHNIDSSQSLIYDISYSEYYKCKTPTPGEENTGLYSGKIYGHFYDKNGDPLRNAKFLFYNNMIFPYLQTDFTGYYTANRAARYYYYDALRYNGCGPDAEVWGFQPVEFDIEPGDSIEVNFISTQTSIIPVIQNTIKFNNYPHPASTYTWFVIDNTDVEASAMRVNVYALNGRKVDSFKPRAYQYRYDCSHLPQGSYIMSLQHGNEVLATKKLQILK